MQNKYSYWKINGMKVSESVIVLTGGYENSTSKLASEYSGIDTDKVSTIHVHQSS